MYDSSEELLISRDPEAREKLTEAGLGLAAAIALTYRDRGLCFQDLIQVGSIGVMRAVDTFRPEAGVPFAQYAAACIHHEFRRSVYLEMPGESHD